MTDKINEAKSPAPWVRKRVLLGTALAAIIGGAVLGEATFLTNQPAFAQPVPTAPIQTALVPDFADLVEKVSPAVVSIRVRQESGPAAMMNMPEGMPFPEFRDGGPLDRFFRDMPGMNPDQRSERQTPQMPRRAMGMGSGFFVTDDGYVVTNNHVVDGATDFTVITQDGTEYPAKLVGKDDKTDLAVLKVDGDQRFPFVQFAKEDPRVGSWVVAVGNPFGLGGTVTAGIVSGNGRQIGNGPYDNYLQIDAAVNRGNSGGPAFNLQGEVVGINTAIFSPSGGNVGIAFAIPATSAEHVVASLREHGAIVRGWLGVQIQPVTAEIADSLRLEKAGGALVTDPQANGPAAGAGIKAGDAILAVNGEAVKDPRDLAMRIATMAPGTDVTVTLWRDGQQQDIQLKLGTLPGEERQARVAPPAEVEPTVNDFGLALGPSRTAGGGVVVTEVAPDSEAAESGLEAGDIILAVAGTSVTTPADVEKAIADAKASGLKSVLVRVRSGDDTRFVALSFERA